MTIRSSRDFRTVMVAGLVALFVVTSLFGSTCAISPATPTAGPKVTVIYTKSGGALACANTIYVHRGVNGYAVIAADTVMTYNSPTKKYTCTFWLPEIFLADLAPVAALVTVEGCGNVEGQEDRQRCARDHRLT